MEQVIIGDGHSQVTIKQIDRTMQNCKTSYPVLLTHWRVFGRNLDINDRKVVNLEMRLSVGILQMEEITYEILRAWKAEFGKQATVKILYDALVETGVRDIAESIEDELCTSSGSNTSIMETKSNQLGITDSEPIWTVPSGSNSIGVLKARTNLSPSLEEANKKSFRNKRKNFFSRCCCCLSIFGTGKSRGSKKTIEQLSLEHALFERCSTDPEILPEPFMLTLSKKHGNIIGSKLFVVSVKQGHFLEFMSLLKRYDHDSDNYRYLLHHCVNNSSGHPPEVIENKLKIISVIMEKQPSCITEELDGCTPILQQNVHIRLLQALVENGADINGKSREWGTILHRTDIEDTYPDILKWVLSNGFNEINFCDKRKLTPLLYAVKTFNSLDTETLDMFYLHGANFNAVDGNGFSILYHAICKTTSIDFLRKIIECGPDVNFLATGPYKINIGHALFVYSEESGNAKYILEMLEVLVKGGFLLMAERDAQGKSVLDYARKLNDPDLISYVREQQKNAQVVNRTS